MGWNHQLDNLVRLFNFCFETQMANPNHTKTKVQTTTAEFETSHFAKKKHWDIFSRLSGFSIFNLNLAFCGQKHWISCQESTEAPPCGGIDRFHCAIQYGWSLAFRRRGGSRFFFAAGGACSHVVEDSCCCCCCCCCCFGVVVVKTPTPSHPSELRCLRCLHCQWVLR